MTERVDPRAAEFLLSLTKKQFEPLFPKSDSADKFSVTDYKGIRNISLNFRKHNYEILVSYKHSKKNPNHGRLMASKTLQIMKKSIEPF